MIIPPEHFLIWMNYSSPTLLPKHKTGIGCLLPVSPTDPLRHKLNIQLLHKNIHPSYSSPVFQLLHQDKKMKLLF